MKGTLLGFIFLFSSFFAYSQCTLSVSIATSSSNLCPGSTMILTASASGGTAPYTYIWSTGETTANITVNKTGTFTVTVSDKTAGCQPVVQSFTVSNPANLSSPKVQSVIVCPNTPATFTVTGPGGDYQWYDAPVGGNFLADGASYTTQSIGKYTLFYVQTTISGCTSSRTAVSASVVGAPKAQGDTVCTGSPAILTASGADSYQWFDAPSNGNLLSTSAIFTTQPLTKSATYYVVGTTSGCTTTAVAVPAKVTPPAPIPTASPITICSGSSAHLHADASGGIFDWFDVPTGGTSLISSPDYTTPGLTTTTTYYVQTSLGTCSSARTPVIVTVNPNPAQPVTQTDTICPNNIITLVASATPTGTYQWYDAPTGGTMLSNTVNYTTPVLNKATTYYVQNSNGSCTSSRTPISVIINTPPDAPSVSEPLICSGGSATLTATAPGGTYQWYDSATGGNLLATDTSYTTPTLTKTTTYYVQTTVNGCVSARKAVKVTIFAPVAGPKAADQSVCSGNSATLTASGSTAYNWYDKATGGNYLSTGAIYITPALKASATFYVEGTTINGCSTTRTAVKVTVNPLPAAPTGSGTPVCPGLPENLTASSSSGTIQWYDSSVNGNLLATGSTYTTPPINANTSYFIQAVSPSSCVSARTEVIAQVISIPSPQFQYLSGTICASGNNSTPRINNPGGVFSAVPAGLVIDPATGEITTSLSTPGKYIVSYSGGGTCTSTSSTRINITTTPNAAFKYSTAEVCQDAGTTPGPSFSGTASAGVFTASPTGLVFFDTSTGQINLLKSQPGSYTITNTITASGGTCNPAAATNTFIIDEPITISAGINQTVTIGAPVQLAGSVSGPTGTTGTWSGGKGTFLNGNSPNAVYTPQSGEKSVTLTFTSDNPAGPCNAKSSKVTITISTKSNTTPNAPTVQGQTICSGTAIALTATAPGGAYVWFSGPIGGTPIGTGATFTTPVLTDSLSYYVQTTIAGLTSPRTKVGVGIHPPVVPPVVAAIGPICRNTSATLTASGTTGPFTWYDAAIGGNLVSVSNPFVTQPLTANTSYYVQTTDNTCSVVRTKVDVVVNPLPIITSAQTANICSGDVEAYTITANIPSSTFLWKRVKVTGISNAAVAGQTSSTITETLVNTTLSPINVTYSITALANGCSSAVFNYVVTVNPKPIVKSEAVATICYGTSTNYTIQFNDPTTAYTWSRAAVTGISNSPVSGQTGAIQEVLFNTTTAPVNVTYVFNYKSPTCDGVPFNLVVTVNPQATITSVNAGIACSGEPQNYQITANIPGTTFTWSRAQVTGISNAAVLSQTSSTITEALVNTSAFPVKVPYIITPIANGCPSTPFTYNVTVNFVPPTPIQAGSNQPICLNSTIELNTGTVPNAKYMWTGPNGFTSTLQNPKIDTVAISATGMYYVYNIVNGCTSLPDSTFVQVDEPPIANSGPASMIACTVSPSIILNGTVNGGTSTGIWTTSGTGTFLPNPAQLQNVQYVPSAQDVANDSVKLTLASTSKDDCAISTSSTEVEFKILSGQSAGGNQIVCSQTGAVQLHGAIKAAGATGGKWTTAGSGTFSPDPTARDAIYIPSADDKKQGSVKLFLTNNSNNACFQPTDSLVITFLPPPIVTQPTTRYVLRGNTITLNPTVSDPTVKYLWIPKVDISDNTVKNPVITGDEDITYTLTVTDSLGCITPSTVHVIVSPQLSVPNAFTPNGDGANDVWNIVGLVAYDKATIDVFNRYGTKVYHSLGYNTSWDGTYNGKPLPMGVYYYVIDTKVNNQVLSGSLTILR
jgi:gliding motility-associated-like protein